MAVIIFVVTYMLHLVRLQIHLNGVLQVGCYGSMSCYGAVFVDRLSLIGYRWGVSQFFAIIVVL